MAKVKVNVRAEDLIRDIKVTPKTLLALAEFWVKRIQGFTRTGTSLVTGKPLKPLSGSAGLSLANKQFGAEKRSIASMNKKLGKNYSVDNSLSAQFQKEQGVDSSYIGFRMRYKGPTGPAFSPAKSNLTLTGQLLESLKPSANHSRQSVAVTPAGTRTDGLTNQSVAGYVAEQGRPFLGLDEKGRARMIRMIIDDLRRTLRNRKTGFRKLSRMVGD